MNSDNPNSLDLGDVRAWIEQESVHIHAADPHGDPVELSEDEAARLGAFLQSWAVRLSA